MCDKLGILWEPISLGCFLGNRQASHCPLEEKTMSRWCLNSDNDSCTLDSGAVEFDTYEESILSFSE